MRGHNSMNLGSLGGAFSTAGELPPQVMTLHTAALQTQTQTGTASSGFPTALVIGGVAAAGLAFWWFKRKKKG